MDPRYEMAMALNADALRDAEERRQQAQAAPCRRRVLGLPIGRPCERTSAC